MAELFSHELILPNEGLPLKGPGFCHCEFQ